MCGWQVPRCIQDLRDGGDVTVVEVDGLVQTSAEGCSVSGENVLSGDLASFNLGNAALGDVHAVGDLLLGQAAGAADLGETVTHDGGEQRLLAGLDRLFAASAFDVGGANVAPARICRHGWLPSSFRRSCR